MPERALLPPDRAAAGAVCSRMTERASESPGPRVRDRQRDRQPAHAGLPRMTERASHLPGRDAAAETGVVRHA